MRSIMEIAWAREALAAPVTVDNVTVTPRSRTLVVRLPKGGFVWNRPTAVVVEQDGRARRIRSSTLPASSRWGCLASRC
jgi:hypothetical protein